MNTFRILSSVVTLSSRPVLSSLVVTTPRSYSLVQGFKCRQTISFSRSCSTAGPAVEGQPQKQSLFQRFKAMYKDYWYVLLPVHVVTSLGWISTFYYVVSSGFDLPYYMKKVGLSDSVVDKVTKSGAGNLAVAYALYKIATPARYAVTLGGTTMAINRLKQWGYIRPAKEIYSANREKLKTFQKSIGEKRRGRASNPKGGSSSTPGDSS